MRKKILVAAGTLAVAAAILANVATAGSARKEQRIAIAIQPSAGTFVLTPLRTGRIRSDSGTVNSCCWTRKFYRRDGEAIEIDDPTVTFTGQHGTFTWYEHITFVDSDNDYTIGTGIWTITKGTGVYAHLEGHGREALVVKTAENDFLASKAQGLVDLRRR